MPYVGRGLTTGAQYQKLDAIAINNATTFTMSVGSANVSPDQNHLILVVNGVIQEPGTGFTVSGSTCTLASAITTSGHSGTDTIYGVIAGDAAFAAYDSIGVNALGVTAGTVTASRAVVPDSNKDIASFRNVTLTGELDAATLDISGNADIDGTTNLDAVDIDGAVQVDNTITVGADDQGYDVKFFGDTASAYMLWDTSADDLVLAGAAGIDLAGDLDVDGTTNLDVVDIDGAVDMASTLGVTGVVTANAGVVVDNITIDGTEIDLSSGNLTIDVAGYTELNNDDGGIVIFSDASVQYGVIEHASSDFVLRAGVQDKDLVFKGNDGGSTITAMTIDISEGGRVGIGTTSPARNLVISSSGQTDVSIVAGTSASAQLQFGDSGDDNIGQIEYNNSDNDMAFYTNATEQMTIKSGGFVGIGTTSPSEILHLNSATAGGDTTIRIDHSNSGRGNFYLRSKNSGNQNWFVIGEETDGDFFTIMADNDGSGGGAGRVGIGDISPDTKLHINDSGVDKDVMMIEGAIAADEDWLGIGFRSSARRYARIAGGSHTYAPDYGMIKFEVSDSSDTLAEKMRIEGNTGNVGIGTTSPQTLLEIAGSSNATLTITNAPENEIVDGEVLGRIDFGAFDSTASTDDYGIGARIEVAADGVWDNSNNADSPAQMKFYVNNSDTSHEIDNAVNQKMTIHSGGLVSIGTSGTGDVGNSPGMVIEGGSSQTAIKFQVRDTDTAVDSNNVIGQLSFTADDNADAGKFFEFADSGGVIGSISANGAGNTAFNTSSDERLKKDIEDVSDSLLDEINKIKVRKFQWNHRPANFHIGLIAQELEKIIPKAVNRGGDDPKKKPYSVAYSSLVPYLIKAVQELSAKVEALEGK